MPKRTKYFSQKRLGGSIYPATKIILSFLRKLLLGSFLFFSAPTFAQVNLTVEVKVDEDGLPSTVDGRFSYSGKNGSDCFYLPYNDTEFGDYSSIERRLEIQQNPFQQISKSQGFIKIDRKNEILVKLQPGRNYNFSASPTRLPDASENIWVWEGFHPKRLAECPAAGTSPLNYKFAPSQKYNVIVRTPSDWAYAGIGAPGQPFYFEGSQFGFAIVREMTRSVLQVGKQTVELFSRSDDFLKLLPTIKRGLETMPRWYGDLPYTKIAIIEADQLEINGIPGLVLFNKPRQDTLQSIQIDWLNWSHWVVLSLLGRQWMGGMVTLQSIQDDWLFRGTIEFVTLMTLRNSGARFNIFNAVERGLVALEFNYRELQELGATVLYQDEPDIVLVDEAFKTVLPLDRQHSQISLRHSLAMRYAAFQLGPKDTKELLPKVVGMLADRSVTPRLFIDALEVRGAEGRQFANNLRLFWQQPGWVDFDIEDFDVNQTGNGYQFSLEVEQEGELDLRANATITDTTGREHIYPLEKKDGVYVASGTLEAEPIKAEIDAERSFYDSDRFNNTTDWPSLKFFPGNALGVPDDDYTILWFPYPFRRPGQPWSIAFNAGFLRYINAVTLLTLETEIGGRNRSAFSVSENYQIPQYNLSGSALIDQNIFGSRVFAKQFSYGPVFAVGPRVDIQSAVRHRQVVGKSKSGHQTIAGGFTMRNRGQFRYLGYNISGEYESAPRATSPRFRYDRRVAVIETLASVPQILDYKLRFFRGEYTFSGEVPEELFFFPEDLKLARLRLDVPGLKRTSKLYSVGNDLFLPFSFSPASGSVLLNRRLRWRLFYDYGRALDLDTEYRAAGGGLLLPLGGDLTGVGTLALTRLNLLYVGYSLAEGEVSFEPRFLFTFGADL